MKTVTIVGTGMGPDTLTLEGMRAIETAEVLLGACRLLRIYSNLNKPAFPEYEAEKVSGLIRESNFMRFAVLVSGDVGFYSAADKLCEALGDCELKLLPGISSLSYFFARLRRPWQEAAVISCHGRGDNPVDTVRRNRLTFTLTGGNSAQIARRLASTGFGELTVHVGEKLGSEEERVYSLTASKLAERETASLAVLLIENPAFEAGIRCGLPDDLFIRGEAPMTKSEIRAVTLSKLALDPNMLCYDVGAGTGSVTVEMALSAYKGHVYAVERDSAAIKLINDNCCRFHIGNVTAVEGCAPDALRKLPAPDAAFIGGSSGSLREIMEVILGKNPRARIVVNAVTLETAQAACSIFSRKGLGYEFVQIGVSRTKPVGERNMLLAQNPVFIISGGGR